MNTTDTTVSAADEAVRIDHPAQDVTAANALAKNLNDARSIAGQIDAMLRLRSTTYSASTAKRVMTTTRAALTAEDARALTPRQKAAWDLRRADEVLASALLAFIATASPK